MKRLILTLFLSASMACAGTVVHPEFGKLSVEGKTAVVGRQLVAAISGSADAIDKLIVSNVLPRTEGVAVLQKLRIATSEAERLAGVLKLIDEARTDVDRTTGVQRAAEIIKSIQRAVSSAVVPVGSEGNRSKVVELLGQITEVITTLALVLPRGPATVMPEFSFGGAR